MSHYPTTRAASRQAWRRLRKTMSEGELRDIAEDIAKIVKADVDGARDLDGAALIGTIEFALSSFNWDERTQA